MSGHSIDPALSRRAFLGGGAALPLAGAAAILGAAPPDQDRFTPLHLENLAIQQDIDAGEKSDAEVEPLFARWREIDNEILDTKPANAAEVVGLLLYARREHLQFAMQFPEDADIPELIVLHALDAALGLLGGALPLAAAPRPMSAAPPDAELRALALEFRSGAERRADATRELDAAERNGAAAEIEEIARRRGALLDRRDALYAPIARAPALTLEGFIAKLGVAAEELAGSPDALESFTAEKTPGYVLAAAVADALALARQSQDHEARATLRAALGLAAA